MTLKELKENVLSLFNKKNNIFQNYINNDKTLSNSEKITKSIMVNEQILTIIEQAEELITSYLHIHPNDIEALFMLALVGLETPMEDDEQAIELMEKILEIDPTNYKALLILAFEKSKLGIADKDTFLKLDNFKTNNLSLQAVIELAKSWHYLYDKNRDKYVNTLKKSISLYNKIPAAYFDLGQHYILGGAQEEGEQYIREAEKFKESNNQYPRAPYTAETALSPEAFININITRIGIVYNLNYLENKNEK